MTGGRIAVLLATFNGEQFLEEQLASLAGQDWPAIDVWASDDGSSDATLTILGRFQANWNKGTFHVLEGPRRGFAENFRSLLANPAITADAYAFCDQDDIWDADKLSVAARALEHAAPGRPGLYCSRTRLVDDFGRPLGLSPIFPRPPAFRNALIQNIGGGNTMLINQLAFCALADSARRTNFASHDWWAYMIVSGMGGVVVYDRQPHIAYRQHGGNLVGNNTRMRARAVRLRNLFAGQLAAWNELNLQGLEISADLLTEECRRTLLAFHAARASALPMRLYWFARSGVQRQRVGQNLVLWIAVAVGKI